MNAKWYKGCTHIHTSWSDDARWTPKEVCKWYKDHGYNFAVLSEHNRYPDIGTIKEFDPRDGFIAISGEEITNWSYLIHINAINIKTKIPNWELSEREEKFFKPGSEFRINKQKKVIRYCLEEIHKQGGIGTINHIGNIPVLGKPPELEVESILGVKDIRFVELFVGPLDMGHPESRKKGVKERWEVFGLKDRLGAEQMWDILLSKGREVYAVAADDSHQNTIEGYGKTDVGHAWIMVKADKLTLQALIESMKRGEFYCSTGLILKKLEVSKQQISITLKPEKAQQYTIYFIGKGGKILKEVRGMQASYKYKNDNLYVRIKVKSTQNKFLFTQPYFI